MAYTKTTWSSGLTLTSTRLNNLETQYDNALTDLRSAANAWTAANSFTGAYGQITVGDTSNANKAGGIWFGRGATPGATGFVGYSSATTNTDFVIKSGGAAGILAFWAGDSERTRIMEDGDFLINRTTDDSSGAKLQVNGDISESGTKLSAKYEAKATTGTFTATLTGMTATITMTCAYTKIGNMVILAMPGATGTSNATTFTITGLPEAIKPTTNAGRLFCYAFNSGTLEQADVQLTAGSTTLQVNRGATGVWTSSGLKGIAACQLAYIL